MRFVCHGCWFRVEIELFAPTLVLRRNDLVPRRDRFAIQRRLLRRLAHEFGQSRSSGLGSGT
jgi:hypothetical protein